jgi:hypothetical protein
VSFSDVELGVLYDEQRSLDSTGISVDLDLLVGNISNDGHFLRDVLLSS